MISVSSISSLLMFLFLSSFFLWIPGFSLSSVARSYFFVNLGVDSIADLTRKAALSKNLVMEKVKYLIVS